MNLKTIKYCNLILPITYKSGVVDTVAIIDFKNENIICLKKRVLEKYKSIGNVPKEEVENIENQFLINISTVSLINGDAITSII